MNNLKLLRFTLLELLMVIAVIATLLILLLSGLSASRKKAMEFTCFSNLKQIYAANVMYLDDNDTVFPGHINDLDGPQGRSWMGKKGGASGFAINVTERPLNKYLGYTINNSETPLTKCPLNDLDMDAYNKVGSSYAGNDHDIWNGLQSKRLNQIQYPETTNLCMEIGAMSYIIGDDKSYWRMTHESKSPVYPFLRIDGSTIRYKISPWEGIRSASQVMNFDINMHL